MKLPYEQLTNRQLIETLVEKIKGGIVEEIWPVAGEVARRMKRLQELLRTSEDYGMEAPETWEKILEITRDFKTYKLNGAGDKYC